MWPHICQQISETTQSHFNCDKPKLLSTGNASHCYQLSNEHHQYFVKTAEKRFLPHFESEVNNLNQLNKSQEFFIPQVLGCGVVSGKSYLALSFIPFDSPPSSQDQFNFGCSLATLHQFEPAKMYGWHEDNYIGTTLQPNQWHKKWDVFFAEQRIGYQLQLLKEAGYQFGDIKQITDAVKRLLHHYQPQPSLLHGDLWQGNYGFYQQQPCLIDPACYYGDRETDIAMAELFGHLSSHFYQGYESIWPIDNGYEYRKPIYQLYHLLNHALMFGEPYIASAKSILINLES